MISSHRFHTRNQGPLYLPIHYHSLFLPILFMRTWTTLSLYTLMYETGEKKPWCIYRVVYGLMYETGEKRPWCCIDREWSLLTNFIHETMDHSLSMQHHGLFSPVSYMRPGTTLCLYNTMVSSHQFHTWEQGPQKRSWCCIDRESSLVSCMKLVRRDNGVV
jgi:hypothetical protein